MLQIQFLNLLSSAGDSTTEIVVAKNAENV